MKKKQPSLGLGLANFVGGAGGAGGSWAQLERPGGKLLDTPPKTNMEPGNGGF